MAPNTLSLGQEIAYLGWGIAYLGFAAAWLFFSWLDYRKKVNQERWKLILRYSLIVSQVIIAIMYFVDYMKNRA